MTDYIRLPRSANDGLWKFPYIGQFYFYVMTKADENGQWTVSLKQLQRDLGMSRRQYRTALTILKEAAYVTAIATASETTITLNTSANKAKIANAIATASEAAIKTASEVVPQTG